MTAMAKELQLSVSRISRLIAAAEAVGGGLGGKRQDLTPTCVCGSVMTQCSAGRFAGLARGRFVTPSST